MDGKHVLFISSSIGLGHVVRDCAIADRLRSLYPDIRITWLAGQPAVDYLVNHGEQVYTGELGFSDMSAAAEEIAGDGKMNLLRYVLKVRPAWRHNVEVFRQVIERENFDCILADEAYEIEAFLHKKPQMGRCPLVVIHDFIGIEATSANPLEHIGVWVINKKWIRPRADLSLFVGRPEDIPDKRLGLCLPNLREFAIDRYTFLGPVLPFTPEELPEKQELKEQLSKEFDLGEGPLIVCSAGGTAVGFPLLEMCGKAFAFIKQAVPHARLLIVTGPRIDPRRLGGVTESMERNRLIIRSFVPKLYRYFAAADVCIVQAGGMTTAELTALGTPFYYVPLEGHSEQENRIGSALERYSSGERLRFRGSTPEELARKIIDRIKTPQEAGGSLHGEAGGAADGAHRSADGAHLAAELIGKLL